MAKDLEATRRRHQRDKNVIDHLAREMYTLKSADTGKNPPTASPTTSTGLSVEEQVRKNGIHARVDCRFSRRLPSGCRNSNLVEVAAPGLVRTMVGGDGSGPGVGGTLVSERHLRYAVTAIRLPLPRWFK
jgi:hypothetical protein